MKHFIFSAQWRQPSVDALAPHTHWLAVEAQNPHFCFCCRNHYTPIPICVPACIFLFSFFIWTCCMCVGEVKSYRWTVNTTVHARDDFSTINTAVFECDQNIILLRLTYTYTCFWIIPLCLCQRVYPIIITRLAYYSVRSSVCAQCSPPRFERDSHSHTECVAYISTYLQHGSLLIYIKWSLCKTS